MTTVNILNRLAQALPVYVKRAGVPTEVVLAPYGWYGPVDRADVLAHTDALQSQGHVTYQELPEAAAPVLETPAN
jgi:hypothetical protein